MNFRPAMNQDSEGNLIGPIREVIHYTCPPSVICNCQSGNSFFEMVSDDLIMNNQDTENPTA